MSLWGVLAVAGHAPGGEAYYLLMFGSQRVPNNPNYSHTFATFAKVSWLAPGPCPRDPLVEAHTISWLPANLKIRVGALLPECGRNFDLYATLDFAHCTGQRVSLWGPYCIQPDLYKRALGRKAELESGRIDYKANDMGYRSDRVCNCIHAISTIAEGPRLRVASPGWGESASYFVLQEFEPWILLNRPTPWVGAALSLDRYPIIYRDWRNPRSNAAFGPVFRLFGNDRDLKATYGPPAH